MIARFIREPECQNLTGLSRTTRWRLEQEGKFPKRLNITENTIGWLSNEIEEWMQSRIRNTDFNIGRIKRVNKLE
jgi:prophage regulatory protein